MKTSHVQAAMRAAWKEVIRKETFEVIQRTERFVSGAVARSSSALYLARNASRSCSKLAKRRRPLFMT